MKKIEFTDRQLVIADVVLSNYDTGKPIGEFLPTELSEITNLVSIALKSPNGSSISVSYTETVVTPAKALEKVDERKEKAREENEKEIAKRMISELETKCEGYESTIEALRKEAESSK
jgi:hypothetical protein